MTTPPPIVDPSVLLRYYSHAYYGNGFFRDDHKEDNAPPKLLSFETGFYGLALDIDDLTKLYYRPFIDDVEAAVSYDGCLAAENDRMKDLPEGLLDMQVTVKNEDETTTIYNCRGMTAAKDATKPYNTRVILWEAGKVSQRFELVDLILQSTSEESQKLEGAWSLTIQVWPDAYCLTLTGKDLSKSDVYTVTLQSFDEKVQQRAKPVDSQVDVSLTCSTSTPGSSNDREASIANVSKVAVRANDKDETRLETTFSEKIASYETKVTYGWVKQAGKLVRTFPAGYTDIRDYDEYDIQVDLNSSAEQSCVTNMIPYVLSMSMPANVTGMCPMLLVNGVPSGIPVQCSKNWHCSKLGSYAKLYIVLPAVNKHNKYQLRISYGFYGSLPSASIAQLSLYGYGNSTGRWDQMAIGCWGETLCLDSEFTCGVQGPITDVRGLFFRDKAKPELSNQKWSWTHCAWGGDWLRIFDGVQTNKRLYARNVKVAYLSHGPCLTHVKYHGWYGNEHQVEFKVSVRTLRTDDYCRTFFDFDYKIHGAASLKNGYLHNLLNRAFHTPTVVHGNLGGSLEERSPPIGMTNNQAFVTNETFVGAAPFWIAFPDTKQFPPNEKGKKRLPDGTKNMIIQSFQANVGETCYTQPAFSLLNECSGWADQGDAPSLMANLELPDGIHDVTAGDSISMTVEWVTLCRETDDYYGPNVQYKAFLNLHPNSWQIPFREVQLNGSLLSVTVEDGGTLVNKYPLQVQVTSEHGVTLSINAGAGAMPMAFCGLVHTNYRLFEVQRDSETGEESETMVDQSTHKDKNDYWQTDYDFPTSSYTMTFNPKVGMNSSSWSTMWRLKKSTL